MLVRSAHSSAPPVGFLESARAILLRVIPHKPLFADVYKTRRRGAPGSVLLAAKVMLNYSQDQQQSTAIRDQFSAEHDLLTDLCR